MLAVEFRKDFVLGGQAIFTVNNPVGEYYTYRVERVERDNQSPIYFVSVLTGQDNVSDYTYVGVLDTNEGKVVLTRASRYNAETRLYRVINWAIGLIWSDRDLPAGYEIRHMGKCAACGRPLTTPASLECGFGPVCRAK